ncbi:MAG TPA: hypothetical protein VMR97_06110 [Acidimicrobiales bacterium]|nr:hypothetical protein [Acidimicrobiales bacterium]
MLYLFGFERLGIALSDLYFVDPSAKPGEEGPERGARVELRYLERRRARGSKYASGPILVGRPIWRVDLLESVENPGTLDRAHVHPVMRRWNPGNRRFEPELTADPLGWLGEQLHHPEELIDAAGVSDEGLSRDFEQIRANSSEIVEVIRRLLERIGNGELGAAPRDAPEGKLVRSGWL